MESRKEKLYLTLAVLFSMIVIISNIITVKLITLPFFNDMAVPAGLLTYPLTFVIGDLITEIYGEKRAKFVIYLGFSMAILTFLLTKLAQLLPSHPGWTSLDEAFGTVFEMNGIALLGSLLAYSAAQIMDIRLFSFLREITKSRHLWFRNIGSTLTSQIIDTLVVNIILLYCGLKLDLNLVIQISLKCYLYKALFATLCIPLFYLCVRSSQRFIDQRPLSKLIPNVGVNI